MQNTLREWYEINNLTINRVTAKLYFTRVRQYLWSAGIKGPGDLSYRSICAYIAAKKNESNLSPSTIKGYINALSNFCNYLKNTGAITENPCRGIKRPVCPELPPRYLDDKEYAQALSLANENGIYLEILMALKTGMRVSEMIKLPWPDIIFESNVIIVRGKGNKLRSIPLHSELKAELLKTPPDRRIGYVFPRRCPRSWHYLLEPLRKDIPKFTKGWEGKRCGRGYHLLRHTMATRLIMGGVSIFKVSNYLGHSSVKMTERYAHYIPQYDEDIEKA